jgi:hypothetical protein
MPSDSGIVSIKAQYRDPDAKGVAAANVLVNILIDSPADNSRGQAR